MSTLLKFLSGLSISVQMESILDPSQVSACSPPVFLSSLILQHPFSLTILSCRHMSLLSVFRESSSFLPQDICKCCYLCLEFSSSQPFTGTLLIHSSGSNINCYFLKEASQSKSGLIMRGDNLLSPVLY